MPVYTIETPSGQKLDIEAADEANAIKGAQQWHAQNGTASSGLMDALRQGLSDVGTGVGETLKQTGIAPNVGEKLKSGAASVAPATAPDTALLDKDGLQLQNAPRFAAEQAPGMAAVIAAGRLGAKVPGGLLAKTLGGLAAATAAGVGMSFGKRATQAAAERTGDPNAEPNTADKTRAALTSGAESVIGAAGASRFLPGIGKVAETGTEGIVQAAKQLALRSGAEAAAGGAQNTAGQVGMSIGTDKGLNVDPTQVGNAAIGSGMTAAALAAPRGAADAANAVRDRNFGGENANATAAVANRIQRLAKESGASLKEAAPVLGARDEISNELSRATSGMNGLDPDTVNALSRAKSGAASPADIARIQSATADHPASDQVVDLARQSAMVKALLNRGIISNGKFKGGMAATIGQHTGLNVPKSAAVAAGTLLASGHLPMFGIYGAPALGAAGAGYGLLRMIDGLSGRRTPAKGFVDKFANTGVPMRAPVAPTPLDPTQGHPEQIRDAKDLMAARRANAALMPSSQPDTKQLVAQMNALVNARKVMTRNNVAATMPALRQLAAPAQQPAQQPDNTPPPAQLKAAMDALVNTRKATAQQNVAQAIPALRELAQRAGQPAQPEPVPTPAPVETNVVPKDVLANARVLMRGRAMVDKMQQQSAIPAREETAPAAPVVPAREEAVKLPKGVTTNAKTLVRGMTAMNRIKDKADKAQAKAEAKAASDAAKVATQTAKAQAKAAAVAEPSVAKIRKSKGKITETPAASVEPTYYTPAEAKYHGMTDQAVADRELADKVGEGAAVKYPAKYKQNVIKARTTRRNAMAEISADHSEHDQEVMANLLEQMHVVRRRSTAIEAVTHYTNMLSPEAAQAVRAKFTPAFIHSIWPK